MAKEMGDIVRYEPASQPAWAAYLILVITVVVVVNAVMFVVGIQAGWNAPTRDLAAEIGHTASQEDLAIWLGNVFLGMAMVLVLYRRFFIDDVMVVKKRHPKYEDFLEKYDIE